jgi:16S rRNA (guanine(1405)-N(7))-methyltransferase
MNVELQPLIEEILNSRKYRGLDIPPETVEDILEKELVRHRSSKDAVKETRKKLHNIVAPYLGDPDFQSAGLVLERAFKNGDGEQARLECMKILASHASTNERIPILDVFYRRLFEVTGKPDAILDLACGLNPFSFPWMGLPASVKYYAYDLNRPRLDFIHQYFKLQGLAPLGSNADILIHPPAVEAPVGFFFKEAHRFEQRQHGCNLPFWQSLRVRYLLVSLPTNSLSGKHNLVERQRNLVYSTVQGQSWKVIELVFENEIVFCIDKEPFALSSPVGKE